MRLTIPIRTISEANRSRHEHWATTAKRVKAQRAAVAMAWRARAIWARGFAYAEPRRSVQLPAIVTLTRIAPRALDDDNLARSFKAVRDQLAAEMGIDDRDPRVSWRYAQRRGKPKEYAVEIAISRREV